MFSCFFCGLKSQSENACSKCGPDSPANNWKSEEVDKTAQVEQYFSILGDLYFDNHSVTEVENLSLRRREKLKISYDTHISILAEFTKQKKSIAHLSKFRFEFNENVTDAYAGHDTFLEFRISNLSDDESLKVSLFWDDPETVDRIELQAESKKFIKPNSTVSINCTSVFDRIGIKEISDLQVTVADEYGEKASFKVEPFRFKVGNPDQRVTNNYSTHNQISIEGRGVIDASGMGANQSSLSGNLTDQKLWKELFVQYSPNLNLELFNKHKKTIEKQPPSTKHNIFDFPVAFPGSVEHNPYNFKTSAIKNIGKAEEKSKNNDKYLDSPNSFELFFDCVNGEYSFLNEESVFWDSEIPNSYMQSYWQGVKGNPIVRWYKRSNNSIKLLYFI